MGKLPVTHFKGGALIDFDTFRATFRPTVNVTVKDEACNPHTPRDWEEQGG